MAAVVLEGAQKPVCFPDLRDKAIIFEGELAAAKAIELYEGYGLPNGLVPLKNVVEGGWVEETGFVWLVINESQKHHFAKADRTCSYDELITCTISMKRMKDIHGVKAKELTLWVPINEILVDEKNSDKITFKSIMGLSRTFPFDNFVLDA
ncbi:hypothetical protein GOP47_0030456 [Adiantum capillus-veneris]|nr:hypothetical protein GOP47_0030456 [Adiantum capillus-veneris]